MVTIYLSLGSNIGDRRRNIEKALLELEKNNVAKLKLSSFYETEPVGPKQRNFYNIAGKFKTDLEPVELLKTLKLIEKKLGRIKTYRWGPRVIDIDILFYGNKIIDKKELIIPHKEIEDRAFVLVPMKEIAPRFVHPKIKKTIQTLWQQLKNV
ncbi:MAG: 2-amino-4-hydroxy-6-hydroxymethyldihydropteridine diphosphokinase [Elusimicrobia bacterium]|nr:2-amino-4-hydroxy-6-hydroxymethyldihydropteridine diphosphokinase [Elusimicrobiota bacterium]